jgi:hypothetical protein
MKFNYRTLILLLLICSCGSGPSSKRNTGGPYFDGDGGKGIRIAILQPDGKNLPPSEQWILSLVQGTLTSDFQKYTAMTVLDRQNLDRLISEQLQSGSGNFSDEDYIAIGKLTNAQYVLVGSIEKTPQGYMLALSISDPEKGILLASCPPRMCAAAELQGLSAVKDASEDLITGMGITLTANGKAAIHDVAPIAVKAETSLSKGIAAQKRGTVVETMAYYYEAQSFDPALLEAAERLSTIQLEMQAISQPPIMQTALVNTGNIGADAKNEIARYKAEQ